MPPKRKGGNKKAARPTKKPKLTPAASDPPPNPSKTEVEDPTKPRSILEMVKLQAKGKFAAVNPPGPTVQTLSPAPAAPKAVRHGNPTPPNPNVPKPTPVSRKTSRHVKPPETAVEPTSPTEIKRMEADGWIFSHLPEDDEEALQLHRETKKSEKSTPSWVLQAVEDLDRRTAAGGGKFPDAGNPRMYWYRDYGKDAEDIEKKEDFHNRSARNPGAASINGLINMAIVPPLGYSGSIRELHKNRLLPDDELEALDANSMALKEMNRWHDAYFASTATNESGHPQREMDDESDMTGDESDGNDGHRLDWMCASCASYTRGLASM